MKPKQLLTLRGIPTLPALSADGWEETRQTLIETLLREEYGRDLPEPEALFFEEEEQTKPESRFAAGLAPLRRVWAVGTLCGRPFRFPFVAMIPTGEGPYPFFVLNNFHAEVPNRYFPAEEIANKGFAVFSLFYKDVTSDDGDFTDGLAGCLYPDGIRRNADDPGKIVMWAWANRRVLDYALRLPQIDGENAAVIGHSRLGKTALVTAMLDTRFRYAAANDSGCSGDALSRGNIGEQISDITRRFPYWFCENYKRYADTAPATFDQHMLLAAIAPRTVMTGAAVEDTWADPDSQYLSMVAASGAWESLGLRGFVAPERMPRVGDDFRQGDLCYHLREGGHYLSRADWNVYLSVIREKMGK